MEKRRKICGDDEYLLLPKGDLIQILVWLPVVSLLRFKSVCKSWRALIESSFFIDLHTTTTFNSSSSKFGSFILLASVDKFSLQTFKRSREHALLVLSSESVFGSGSESVFGSGSEPVLGSGSEPVLGSGSESVFRTGSGGCWWSTDDDQRDDYDDQMFKVDNLGGGSSNDDNDQQQLVFKLDSLGFPSLYKFCNVSKEIVGTCNGLVCLYDRDDHKVSIWNPATRQFKSLPESMNIDNCPHRLVAFGFDVETKDYKVVLLAGFRPMFYRPLAPTECFCRIQIYSLSTNSWRLLGDGITCLPGYPFRYSSEGLWLNGSCFFLAQFFHTKQQPRIPKDDRFIISFDLNKEIITPIQLPDHHPDQELYLNCLGDKMALFTVCYEPPLGTYYPEICGYEDYNIWVLNEQVSSSSTVNKGSWTNLHSFRIEHKRPGEWNLPRGISNDGKFALLETRDLTGLGKKMKLYNLVTKEVKKNFLSCSSVMSRANAYKPSLVPIIDGNGEEQQQQQQQPIG